MTVGWSSESFLSRGNLEEKSEAQHERSSDNEDLYGDFQVDDKDNECKFDKL